MRVNTQRKPRPKNSAAKEDTMKSRILASIAVALCVVFAAGGKKPETRFKSIEVTHFSREEGVELAPEFSDFLYAAMREKLQKSGLFEQIVGEGEVVEPSETEQSLIVKGSIREYKKGSMKKRVIGGVIFGQAGAAFGQRNLRAQITVRRRSNNESILDQEMIVKAPMDFDQKRLATLLADRIAKEMKKSLKH